MNRCSTGTTVLERETARYRSLEQRYRYNKIRVKDYGEYVVQWVQMLIMGEDDILEGISGILFSWDKREKRV